MIFFLLFASLAHDLQVATPTSTLSATADGETAARATIVSMVDSTLFNSNVCLASKLNPICFYQMNVGLENICRYPLRRHDGFDAWVSSKHRWRWREFI
jgi:hypothetical protein